MRLVFLAVLVVKNLHALSILHWQMTYLQEHHHHSLKHSMWPTLLILWLFGKIILYHGCELNSERQV